MADSIGKPVLGFEAFTCRWLSIQEQFEARLRTAQLWASAQHVDLREAAGWDDSLYGQWVEWMGERQREMQEEIANDD